jgi:hypothetical protein
MAGSSSRSQAAALNVIAVNLTPKLSWGVEGSWR